VSRTLGGPIRLPAAGYTGPRPKSTFPSHADSPFDPGPIRSSEVGLSGAGFRGHRAGQDPRQDSGKGAGVDFGHVRLVRLASFGGRSVGGARTPSLDLVQAPPGCPGGIPESPGSNWQVYPLWGINFGAPGAGCWGQFLLEPPLIPGAGASGLSLGGRPAAVSGIWGRSNKHV